MVTLATSLGAYLHLCEARGANADGHCPACAWARSAFDEAVPLARALDALGETPIGLEAAMFAFEHMLDLLSPAVRERFARIIAEDPSAVLRALSWKRLVAAHHRGAPAPTEAEDWILRGSWHSSWRGHSDLPEWERVE
jgi:hypothetical protein